MRIFKEHNDNGTVGSEFYLRDATGRELAILDLQANSDPGMVDWEWFAFGAQRWA